jgi:hypothetical protein
LVGSIYKKLTRNYGSKYINAGSSNHMDLKKSFYCPRAVDGVNKASETVCASSESDPLPPDIDSVSNEFKHGWTGNLVEIRLPKKFSISTRLMHRVYQ